MTPLRFIGLSLALASASILIACTTAPTMPMGAGPAQGMASPEHMAAMDAQMKAMREMHAKMMNARTPDERQALMADHMKAMQGGMSMMKNMPSMGEPTGMAPEMAAHHKTMTQHMEMMQMMTDMMSQRMAPGSGRP